VGVGIASYTDIRNRDVHDIIPLIMVGSALLIRGVLTLATSNPFFLFEGLFTGILFLVFSILMVSLGVWGEGDGTILTAIGVCLGITPIVISNPNALLFPMVPWIFPFTIILNIFLSLTVFDIMYMGILILKNKDKRSVVLQSIDFSKTEIGLGLILSILSAGFWIVLLLLNILCPLQLLIIGPLIIWIFLLGKKIAQVFDEKILWKEVSLKQLRIGDKIRDPVTKDGNVIIPRRQRGLSREDIEIISQGNTSHQLQDTLIVRQGIPGIPAILIALVLTLIFGDLVMIVVSFMACFRLDMVM
jgi:hypothetical protein